jgi:spire-like protein
MDCANHLAVDSEAQPHFRAVCRALVSEAIELSSFMEKVKRHETQSNCEELENLELQDWARLWRQVLKDLRSGVKLKNIDYTKTPLEFELTPYEILMDEIKSRKYSLNKVMVEGELPPRMKKDANDLILQFIRSRPPLKPVSSKVLTLLD